MMTGMASPAPDSRTASSSSLVMASPVGPLHLGSDGTWIIEILFIDHVEPDDDVAWCDAVLVEARRQLMAYFAGDLMEFDLPLAAQGTDFQRRVWAELERIPFGETASYGQIAQRLGFSTVASRAIGTANGANPIAIVVPCHRVIGADGTLTGYAGGLPRKKFLLDLESTDSAQGSLFR